MTTEKHKNEAVIFGDDNHTELMMMGYRLEIRNHLKEAMSGCCKESIGNKINMRDPNKVKRWKDKIKEQRNMEKGRFDEVENLPVEGETR